MFYEVLMEKRAVDTSKLRRAARKLVYKSKARLKPAFESLPNNADEIDDARRFVKQLELPNSTAHLNPHNRQHRKLRDLRELVSSGKPAGATQESLDAHRHGKENIQHWIKSAKEEALQDGEPREWRDYLPRKFDRMRTANVRIRRAKAQQKQFAKHEKQLSELERSVRTDAKDDLGRALTRGGGGKAGYNPATDKINFHGFKDSTPESRATVALHEFNERLEAKRYKRKGIDPLKAVTTDRALGPGNVHANATLPIRDLNIARTATGKNSARLREEFENLRAGELVQMKQKMPSLSPLLRQLEGAGATYSKRGPSKTVAHAQSILSSGTGSDAVQRRARAIVSKYETAQKPNVRLNRREIDHVRDVYDKTFN